MDASLLSTRPNMPPITRSDKFKLTVVVLYHWMVMCLFTLEGRVVNAKPDFSYEPQPYLSIKEGSSVSMACLLNKEAADSFKVVWTKDSYYIENQNRFSVSKVNDRQYTLQIDPVKREDEGIYKCVGNKENGTLYDTIFTSGCQLLVIKIPGPQYPEVCLSQTRYNIGQNIIAYCISERVDTPSNLTWVNSPDVGIIEPIENSSYVGVKIRFKAVEKVNQTTILCKMTVDGVAVPRFKRSMPIVVNPILQKVVTSFESASISAVVLTNSLYSRVPVIEDTIPSNADGIEYMSLIKMFTCLLVFSIL
ncbi:neuronal cell adhesion molecule-like isoform X2 [Anneissia japonica]|uniref:neuronal cell adhesion molecule-like isoform X2 n=1 Tax=Anneissia japonica TaxID=1529436 RepID=UPI001425699D|nr:neuronal cell adhesion molecule-like isoform X2 [Anneissia japonica]